MTGKREKTSELIMTYFFFGAATSATLAFRLLATEPPPLGEATVQKDG